MRRSPRFPIVILLGALAALSPALLEGQSVPFHRLPAEILDAGAPGDRVQGEPGAMSLLQPECRSLPLEEVRRRIVDVTVQEWGFFGFPVLDRMNGARLLPPGTGPAALRGAFEPLAAGWPPPLDPSESARVASSIAGYWAVTPEGRGIVAEQNRAWNGPQGVGARWRAPWSAAFISWVMCEGGLGSRERFHRAVAHWTYIDQAIRARDGRAAEAAYVAYDIGEAAVVPGDLLCAARRPRYRNLAERRRQLGVGARSHCDVVVAVDADHARILAIGGNVLRSVSLKVLAGAVDPEGRVRARSLPEAPLFAHLSLRAGPIEANALMGSPTMAALACPERRELPPRVALVVSDLRLAASEGMRC